jgi:uncharacterized Zn finger protein (UPF0148 family)
MAVIACPGCGLPRADDQVGVVPCPICAASPAATPTPTADSRPPLAKTPPADPTAGLPADVSELERASDLSRSPAAIVRMAVPLAFLLGAAAGVGGLLAWQAAFPPVDQSEDARPRLAEVAAADQNSGGLRPPLALAAQVAPMPREARSPEPVSEPPVEPKIVAKGEPKVAPPPARAVVIDLNQPDAVYTLPAKQGEHIVLRGQVRMLRVSGLDAGAILDATGLDAGSVYVTGKIDGGSVLKINCPDGVVQVPAAVTGKSRVEINAQGGSVRFSFATAPNRAGSLIDGGSTVAITARTVDLRGDVDGADTKVTVTLTRNGSLKVAAVRGTAAVVYRAEDAKAPAPTATAGTVAPTATFKKAD